MNKVIESFLNTHIHEYEIEEYSRDTAFEHFINRCIINKYSLERFDPSDIMTDKGEKGLDGVAIIINERIVLNEDDLLEILENETKPSVKFVFVQTKTSESFSGSEIGDFIYGVKAFFAGPDERPSTNEKMENLISLKDKIYDNCISFDTSPSVDMYYVCCGRWDKSNGLNDRIALELKPLKESADFSNVEFFPYDTDKIITTYKELKKKITRTLPMEKRVTFPPIQGVRQAFMGIVKCIDFTNLLLDSDKKMLTNIFEDNVRDFQGYNLINTEIQDTIRKEEDQNRFALLNNGITIVAKSIKLTGDSAEIYDYQIVNGCQTSYVLCDNVSYLTNDSYIAVKLIEVSDPQIKDRVIYTTNRQTEVKAEAFTSTKQFHKGLQDYYDSIEPKYRLYYERRSKQYDLDDSILKNRVISLATQITSYVAVFLGEPHSTHRYYGELLRNYDSKIFLDTDAPDVYFIAAYLVYYVDDSIRRGSISKEYKQYRYHIAYAIKVLEVGNQVIYGQSRAQRKEAEKIYDLINDENRMYKVLQSAVTCLKETLDVCNNIPQNEQHRRREVTKDLLERTSKLVDAKNKKEYLKLGDQVHCIVESVTDCFVNVRIKTEDSRKYGSIHISEWNGKYISDLTSQAHVSMELTAEIIDDMWTNDHGWKLSRKRVNSNFA